MSIRYKIIASILFLQSNILSAEGNSSGEISLSEAEISIYSEKALIQAVEYVRNNEINMTSFSLTRDLHCWQLDIYWVPFGQFRSYNVSLRAKASILQDLKVDKKDKNHPFLYCIV